MFSPRPDDPTFDSARASKIGGLAIGVPGELRGLEAAYKACGGGVSWERLFQPSAKLARESRVGKELARRLNVAPFGTPMSAWMLDETDWSAMFAPEGRLLKEGEILRREAHARTLERIGKEGADVFYEVR
jgi:gamma-glutamyltranspeptidase/glutathione hydrolase/leukotriene-C4 hydrolase